MINEENIIKRERIWFIEGRKIIVFWLVFWEIKMVNVLYIMFLIKLIFKILNWKIRLIKKLISEKLNCILCNIIILILCVYI